LSCKRSARCSPPAELQIQAKLLSAVHALTPEEIKEAAAYNLRPGPMERAWDLWAMRLARKEAEPGASAATGA
jgi:hypothetical protein